MGTMSDLMGRAERWLSWEAPKQTQVVPADAFDTAVMDGIIAEAEPVSEYRDKMAQTYNHATDLVRDLGALCFQPTPSLRNAAEVDPRVVPSRALLEAAQNAPEMEQLRQHTVYDRWATAAAMSVLAHALEPFVEKAQEEQVAAEQRQAQAEAAKEELEKSQAAGDTAGMERALGTLEGLERDGAAASEEIRAGASQAVSRAVKDAAKDAEQSEAVAAGWGLEEGELMTMDFATRARMAEAMQTNRMSKWLALIGRMRMAAFSENARKSDDGRDEAYAITLGSRFSDFLPSEIMALSHPALRLQTLPRLAEGRMVSRKWRGTQKEGKGPIVCLVDTSGSMNGEPEAWAKAFTLALMDLARKQKRPMRTVLFSTKTHVVDGTTREAAFEVGTIFLSGGTNWMKPLDLGMSFIRDEGSLHKADLLLITDGVAGVDAAWLSRYNTERERLAVRAWGIFVGAPHDSDYEVGGPALHSVCDNVRGITTMTDTQAVADIFQAA